MNTFATTRHIDFADDALEPRVQLSFFRKLYIRIFHLWLYIDGKRVMRDARKGRLRTIESLDELM